MADQKYYVVWAGRRPGIYTSWTEAQRQISGFKDAKFKSFKSRAEAEFALKNPDAIEVSSKKKTYYYVVWESLNIKPLEASSWLKKHF